MYTYDDVAMAQPSTLDPYRVAATMTWATTDEDDVHSDGTAYVGTVDHTLMGPRGAQEFATMWAQYRATGELSPRLKSILAIRIGGHGPAAQRQMIGILRWLLACAGHGEDVMQDAMLAALEARNRGRITVGEVMAHTPAVIEQRDWARREPARSSTPLEWLE